MAFLGFLLLFVLAAQSHAANPSPRLKQLDIGQIVYSHSDVWGNNTNNQIWFGEHFAFAVGSGDNANTAVGTMQTRNPALNAYVYALFLPRESDIAIVKGIIDSLATHYNNTQRFSYDTMFNYVSASVDSIRINATAKGIGGSGNGQTLGNPNMSQTSLRDSLIKIQWFKTGSVRPCLDYRNPLVGYVLALYMIKRELAGLSNYDGFLIDEFVPLGLTNTQVTYDIPFPFMPFRGTNWAGDPADYYGAWLFGRPETHLKRPWVAVDLSDAVINGWQYYGDANGTATQWDIADSLLRLQEGWMKYLGDSLSAWGYKTAPNFAATGWSADRMSAFANSARRSGQLLKGYLDGEYSYSNPHNSYDATICQLRHCFLVKDDNIDFMVGWIKIGDLDVYTGEASTRDFSRSEMLALGHMLGCTFPGSTRYKFMTSVENDYTAFLFNGNSRCFGRNCQSDTIAQWSAAWGKYFGVPNSTRDTSTYTGTINGQPYKVMSFSLARPNSTEKLTQAFVRYGRGGDCSQTNAVSVTLPVGQSWYQLIDGNNSSSNNDALVRWGTELAGGTSITIKNAEAKIFSSDTILANAGIGASADLSSIVVDSLRNDFSGEQDSLQFTYVTANDPAPDTTIVLWSTTGYRTDSMSTTNALRAVHSANTTVSHQFTMTQAETWTLYLTAWTFDKEVNGWSNRKQAQRTFQLSPILSIGTQASLTEGSGGGSSQLDLLVFLSAAQGSPKNFRTTTADGTATAASGDYTAQSNVLRTFPQGQTSMTVPILIGRDAAVEGDETFTISISSPDAPLVLGNSTCTITITNDDAGAPSMANRGVKMVKVKAVKVGVI